MKPATKVVFPGIEFGSTKASKLLSPTKDPGRHDLTFIEVRCHPLVITTDEGVVLGEHSLIDTSGPTENFLTRYKLVP